MLLQLTPDQEFLRETTAKFLVNSTPVGQLRKLRDDPAGYEDGYWRQGAELGWTSLLVPEDAGGGSVSGHGLVDAGLLAYEIGRHAAPGPFLSCNIVAAALGTERPARHTDVLEALLTGSSVASWCFTEAQPLGYRPDGLTLDIRIDGDEVVVDGTKRPVESAAQADYFLVTGRTGDSLTQVLVPAGTPGVSIQPMQSVDLTRRFSVVHFDQVRLPAHAIVGEAAGAGGQVELQLRQALVLLCAESVGAMQVAFDMTVEWAFDRYTFGRPLASYQELKHRFADMKTWLEGSHAVADVAAAAVDAGDPDAPELVRVAAAYIGEYGAELLQDCVQIHGGIGVTYEHDLHLYLRRVTLNRAMFGTPALHRRRIAELQAERPRPVGGEGRPAGEQGRTDHNRPAGQEQSGGVSERSAVSTEAVVGTADAETEDVRSFGERARTWVQENLRPVDARVYEGAFRTDLTEDEELAEVAREREVQHMLFEAGFAGICVPVEYGGRGLTPAHQRALNDALVGYEYPSRIQAPTFSPCLGVLLEFGSEEQKRRHVPAILAGEELWMQLLSEPGGGSDMAGALTTAVRDGEQWVLNGSKIWTTGAWWSDWGLCLVRTNWDVPKHRGLTVFILPLKQPGIEIHRIELLNGSKEFCQEFLTDVIVPDTDRIGTIDEGWTVGVRWMFHERMLYESPLITAPTGASHTVTSPSLVELVRDAGRTDDPSAQELVGEARMLDVVFDCLQERIGLGIRTGLISDQAAALPRLLMGTTSARVRTIAFDLAGTSGGAWTAEDGSVVDRGTDFLLRQIGCIGGGTTEMARNVISERVLGMPRERSFDRDVPFRDVPRGRSSVSPEREGT